MTAKMVTVAAALALLATPLLAQKPDFTGSWKLNTAQTDAPPAGGGGGAGGGQGRMMGPPAELFITQTSNRIIIESKGESTRMASYNLDGSDSKNPGMRGNEMTTRSSWLDDAIVTEGENTMTTPMGEMKIKTKEVRSLSADGRQMTVVSTFSTPRGERTRKLVYDKA